MTTKTDNDVPTSTTKKPLTEQEKRAYYSAWETSGMNKRRFCKEHGLSEDDFYYWHKLFKPKTMPKLQRFAPVVTKTVATKEQHDVTQVELRLPNQAQLLITLREHQLVSFIQELCNAVTIIR